MENRFHDQCLADQSGPHLCIHANPASRALSFQDGLFIHMYHFKHVFLEPSLVCVIPR